MTFADGEPTDRTEASLPSSEQLLDESGHFHAHDAPIDLSAYAFEAWIAFGFFWLLAVDIATSSSRATR